MHFNIDIDEGTRIQGWLVPDNPGATPKIVVIVPGRKDLIVEATIARPDVHALGIHSNAHVGFEITNLHVPDLADQQEIEVVESETRLPLYRRFQISRHIERKLIYLEASLMPQITLMHTMRDHFALTYNYAERHSLETMLVIIHNYLTKSILVTGRVNFNRYATWLRDTGFVVTAMLRNPFEELAERLLFIKLLRRSERPHILPTLLVGIEPLVDFTKDLRLDDDKALAAAFRGAGTAQRDALRSPMTRLFGCNIDELPQHKHVAIALDNLASMDLVGTRVRFPEFRSMLTTMLGADVLKTDALETSDTVDELAERLAQLSIVRNYLEQDLALYSYVEEAVDVGSDKLEAKQTETSSPRSCDP